LLIGISPPFVSLSAAMLARTACRDEEAYLLSSFGGRDDFAFAVAGLFDRLERSTSVRGMTGFTTSLII
jgi:hypothetical protein